jgi:adenylate cyclase
VKGSARAKRILMGAAVGVAVGVVAAAVAYSRPPALELAELSTYDMRVRAHAGEPTASKEIVLVEVSEQAISDVEDNLALSWPWPRSLFGYIASYASAAGAKAVVYDWLFEDRRFITEAEEFAHAMREAGNVVIGLALTPTPLSGREGGGAWAAELGTFDARADAEHVALTLLSWNLEVYLVGEEPTTLYYGGKASPEAVMMAWQRLVSADELMHLFLTAEGELAPPPTPRELSSEELAGAFTAEAIIRERDGLTLEGAERALPVYAGLDPPLPIIAAGPARTGTVYQMPEADGIIRRHAVLVWHEGRAYPSLALAAYLVANPDVELAIERGALILDGKRFPLDEDGKLVTRYHGQHAGFGGATYERISAYSILRSAQQVAQGEAPEIGPEQLAGKYVVVAPTARALRDIVPTPVARAHVGAEVNANVLDNLERGDYVKRASRGADAAIAFGLCLAMAVVIVGLWSALGRGLAALAAPVVAAAVLLAGYALLASWAYAAHGLWLAVATPSGGAALAAFATLLVTSASERRGRRFVQEALGRYTSPALVRTLTDHPEYLSLEWGETREMSVYFSDIAGFTTISENLAPEKLVALLNEYLTEMTDIVLAHEGVVDKYIGDAIMAFWGAPLPDAEHAARSVLAAIDMRQRCEALRPEWERRYGQTLLVRAGINSGQAVVGNMGSRHKYNYTVMGDMVNLAARLEGANKAYGTFLMISESTRAAVGDAVDVRELDLLTVKGKEEPVRVYEVLDRAGRTGAELLEAVAHYEEGLRRYRARAFEGAVEAFERCLSLRGDDGPSTTYIERCRHFLANPPPESWDGVWRLKEK